MTEISASGTFYNAIIGDLKIINWIIDSPHAIASQDTLDLTTDSAGGKINQIHHAIITPTTGVIGGATAASGQLSMLFSGQTGILTFPADYTTRASVLVIGT